MQKEFLLEGLGCAGCAAKMEKEIKEIKGISHASISFATKKLIIESGSYEEEILSKIKQIVQKIEPHVQVIDENKEHNHHDHHHKEWDKEEMTIFFIGLGFFLAAVVFQFGFWTELILYLISYMLIGKEILLGAGRNLLKGQLLDENFLMSIASMSAFFIKEFPEAVAVMLFFKIGEFFETLAVNRSRKSIESLLDIRPDFANLKMKNTIKKVSPEQVKIGEIILVKPGEKIPLDGKVIDGASMIDTSILTGETVPRKVKIGDEVFSGAINKNGLLTVVVTKGFRESTVSKILELVEKASNKKAKTEKFITKFSRFYTPAVVASAVFLAVIPPIIIEGATFSEWIYRAAIFLVVSCPCALVISIPLGFFGGIGGASKNGILIKGGNYLEALNKVDTIIFDKTGTLTKGVFKVTKINAVNHLVEDELLKYAAYAEYYSNHPIATSIRNFYGKKIDEKGIKNYEEIAGYGIKAVVEGKKILVGNYKLMKSNHIDYEGVYTTGTIVHIAIDGKYEGYMVISDEMKEDTMEGIKELKKLGIKNIVMLTGDHKNVAERIAKELGIDQVYAELLPHQKVEKLEQIQTRKNTKENVIFVGDGINDAPVLARADVGVAMGGLGSDAAIEAADVVLMTDEISKLSIAMKIAKRTRKIVWQNILFSLGVKGIVLILGAAGMATMWEAVFADVGVAVIAILNAMRVMHQKHAI